MNRSDIAGKRIKLEPSRPGGARRKYVSIFYLLHLLVIIDPYTALQVKVLSHDDEAIHLVE